MELSEFLSQWESPDAFLSVQTSGSTGKPKMIAVEKVRMLSSARMTCDFLGLKEGDSALLCMSLDYIAGKMMVIRSIERKLELHTVKASNHPLADVDYNVDFAAMVPSQVYCSLKVPSEKEKLMSIENLIIGGGHISSELENELRSFPNNVWSTYGMTETLSHIALRKINGDQPQMWYRPFDSINVSLSETGTLVIEAPEISDTVLYTNDIVEFHKDGRMFKVIGRIDNVICCGGVKLHMEEIEEKLRPSMKVPYCISKRNDRKFGEIAVLLMEGQYMDLDFSMLDSYLVPKAVKIVPVIPYTETGKVKRKDALQLALSWSDGVMISIKESCNDILKLPFISQLADGTLPKEKFQRYLSEERYYLRNFSKEMNMLSKIIDDHLFSSFADAALQSEKQINDRMLNCDMQPHKITESYNNYCMEILRDGNRALSLSVMLPCMWLYMEIGRKMVPIKENNPYRQWIDEYTSPEYEQSVDYMIQTTNRIADRSSGELRSEMFHVFRKSLIFEYEFWKNVY